MVWKSGTIKKEGFRNIADYLPEDSMLVFNNTRVIHARLFFWKETGAKIEIFCLEPVQPNDHQLTFQQTEKVVWKCMVGNSKKWKNDELSRKIEINGQSVELRAKKTAQENNSFLIEFSWTNGFSFAEILEKSGVLPIPPYLNRDTEPSDEVTYQTVYAKTGGSVAAPTAGLHFTENVMAKLRKKNIALREITLHVGAGTFQPVKSETINGHNMHHEQVIIPKKFIEELLSNTKKIIAVGTTSVRSLESLYWLGLKLGKQKKLTQSLVIEQWEPYENTEQISIQQALKNIVGYLEKTNRNTLQFSTQIIIVPGYRFKLITGMITNFHQPQSTLLLLIGAFLG
ncbi:MAG: S-adenosylmethionine:tRNA ribosyltransferase-isomerase, partial [Bacteroidales bacterium]|nr:S-adenosylmethionine:tRNA ribosyltransferase-isomerase [Bacteroidales bacterium]